MNMANIRLPRWFWIVRYGIQAIDTTREFLLETVQPNWEDQSLAFLVNFYLFEKRVVDRLIYSFSRRNRETQEIEMKRGWRLFLSYPEDIQCEYAGRLVDEEGNDVLVWRRGVREVRFDLVDHSALKKIGKIRLF